MWHASVLEASVWAQITEHRWFVLAIPFSHLPTHYCPIQGKDRRGFSWWFSSCDIEKWFLNLLPSLIVMCVLIPYVTTAIQLLCQPGSISLEQSITPGECPYSVSFNLSLMTPYLCHLLHFPPLTGGIIRTTLLTLPMVLCNSEKDFERLEFHAFLHDNI